MKTPFWSYYFGTIARPQRTFDRFFADKRAYAYGFLYILIPLIGYTLMYIFLTIGNGAPSVFTPWLNISKEDYYSVNRFLLAPSMMIAWFLSAAVMQVLAVWAKGSGTFEQTLAVTGLAISMAMWGTLFHDLVMSFLSAVHVINARQHEIAMNSPTPWRTILWICMLIYLVAFLLLFGKGIKAAHRLSAGRSALIGLTGFLVFQLMFLLFNR
jgi:hypothetical protein